MMNSQKVFNIVQTLGTPEPIDPQMTAKWGKYAKVRVRLDITKPIPKDMVVTLKSKKKIPITFRYEKLPRLCFYCGFFGHLMKQCLHLSKKLEEDNTLPTEEIALRINDKSMARYTEEIRAFHKSSDPGSYTPNYHRTDTRKITETTQEPSISEGKEVNAQMEDTRHLQMIMDSLQVCESRGQDLIKNFNLPSENPEWVSTAKHSSKLDSEIIQAMLIKSKG